MVYDADGDSTTTSDQIAIKPYIDFYFDGSIKTDVELGPPTLDDNLSLQKPNTPNKKSLQGFV